MALALACCCSASKAAINFDAGYEFSRESDTRLTTEGFGAGASLPFAQYFGIGARYSRTRTEPFTDATDTTGRLQYDSASASLSAAASLTSNVGASLSAGYSAVRTSGTGGFRADEPTWVRGPTGALSLSARTSTNVEMWLGPSYSYINAVPAWSAFAGIGLRLVAGLWVDGSYWRAEGVDGWSVGLRTDFRD